MVFLVLFDSRIQPPNTLSNQGRNGTDNVVVYHSAGTKLPSLSQSIVSGLPQPGTLPIVNKGMKKEKDCLRSFSSSGLAFKPLVPTKSPVTLTKSPDNANENDITIRQYHGGKLCVKSQNIDSVVCVSYVQDC